MQSGEGNPRSAASPVLGGQPWDWSAIQVRRPPTTVRALSAQGFALLPVRSVLNASLRGDQNDDGRRIGTFHERGISARYRTRTGVFVRLDFVPDLKITAPDVDRRS